MSQFHLEELSLAHEKSFLSTSGLCHSDSSIVPAKFKDAADFRKFIKASEKERLDWRPGPKKVSLTRYVMLDETGNILALAMMRFPLDTKSELEGGNLRCEVPTALRNKGHGSYCLALLLFEAVRAGLRRVLLTCPANDQAACRVIEKNRGQLDAVVTTEAGDKIARYWIQFS